ncbi:MerR family transcriptional regulator [Actinacidiphila rubida]|uniref:Transcriptional regulator n=1 Tax=Actinacidiphila rubida TaxID=310780 RepID=A0A1H8L4D3_9ACTN|nr:MerR family transcriptional regulator [Actinacidiphila rubida]SEN99983.1 transcriptional regulator [Actinacidiphila rubida]
MRLAELSERSGVSTATIKYYLREGLLAPGHRVSATQADYDDAHLRRLRLIRALIQIGRVPVATARQVLAHVDDESLGQTIRLGAALWEMPHEPEPDESDPETAVVRAEVDRLLERLGWSTARELGTLSPNHRVLTATMVRLKHLGYPVDADTLLPYAQELGRLAVLDLDRLEEWPTPGEKVEAAVAGAVLFEPVLLSLRRLAQEEESARRFGLE